MNGNVPGSIVKATYENPDVVAGYRTKGLRKVEEIMVRRFFPNDGRVLDIGCGTGRTSFPLNDMGYGVVGIDLSSSMIKVAAEEAEKLGANIDFKAMDATVLDFPDESFDAALFSANGIDHIPGYTKKLECLGEVFRVLKPGAPYIFSVHRIWSPLHVRKIVASGLWMSLGKVFGFSTREKEWGELYYTNPSSPEEAYGQFLPSHSWKKALRTAGFEIVSNQSRFNIEYGYGPAWLRKCLGPSNYMFYVARKPGK